MTNAPLFTSDDVEFLRRHAVGSAREGFGMDEHRFILLADRLQQWIDQQVAETTEQRRRAFFNERLANINDQWLAQEKL